MTDAPPGLNEFILAKQDTPAPSDLASASNGLPPGLDDFVSEEMLEDEYGGPTGALAAGAAHVVSSALPYVGIKGMEAVGFSPEKYENLTKANPVASGVGDLAGVLKSPIMKVGQMVGAIAPAGSIAARSLQYGTEGGLISLSNAANESALGDPNLNAQKLFTDVGLNMAMGIALGPVSKVVEAALPAAGKKLASSLKSLKTDIFGTVENPSAVTKAMSGVGGKIGDHTPTQWSNDILNGMNSENATVTVPKLTKNLTKVHEASEKAALDLEDALFSSAEKPSSFTKGPFKNFPPKEGTPLIAEGAAEVASKEDETLFDLLTTHKAASKEFQETFMKEAKSGWEIDPKKIESFAKGAGKIEAKAVQSQVLDNFVNSATAIADATENYSAFQQAEKSISSHIKALAKEHSVVRDAIEAMRLKPKHHGEGIVSDMVLGGVGALAHVAGASNPVIAAGIGMAKAYQALDNPYTMGKALKRTFDTLKVIGDIAEKTTQKMNSASKAIFSNQEARKIPIGQVSPTPAPTESKPRSYDSQIARIQDLMTNPGKLQDHLEKQTADIHDVAPDTSAGLHQTILNALQFLNSKVPRPQTQMLLSGEWKPSKAQTQIFSTYLAAIDDPFSVLKQIKNGTLTREPIEALQAVMPNLLQDMRAKVIENLDPKKASKLPYAVKLSLGKFLGEPLDESMLPRVIASNQLSLQGPQESNQSAPKQPRTTVSGMKELDIAGRAKTETQDLEDDN